MRKTRCSKTVGISFIIFPFFFMTRPNQPTDSSVFQTKYTRTFRGLYLSLFVLSRLVCVVFFFSRRQLSVDLLRTIIIYDCYNRIQFNGHYCDLRLIEKHRGRYSVQTEKKKTKRHLFMLDTKLAIMSAWCIFFLENQFIYIFGQKTYSKV